MQIYECFKIWHYAGATLSGNIVYYRDASNRVNSTGKVHLARNSRNITANFIAQNVHSRCPLQL